MARTAGTRQVRIPADLHEQLCYLAKQAKFRRSPKLSSKGRTARIHDVIETLLELRELDDLDINQAPAIANDPAGGMRSVELPVATIERLRTSKPSGDRASWEQLWRLVVAWEIENGGPLRDLRPRRP